MTGSHPLLGFIACLLYLGVSATALAAWRVSDRRDDRVRWAMTAGFFLIIALLRGSGAETAVTTAIRESLLQDGLYEHRRDVQRPLAALAVVLISSALGLFYVKRPKSLGRKPPSPRSWPRFWAMVGITLMCGVVLMRLISFHDLDRYLYGPVRMNWILDIGSSALVALSALHFRRISGGGAIPAADDRRR